MSSAHPSQAAHIYGNVHDQDGVVKPEKIIELWLASPNYRYGAKENNWCPAKKQMLPYELQAQVLEELQGLQLSTRLVSQGSI